MTAYRATLAAREPVRLWVAVMAVPVVALLVGYGVLTDTTAALWLAVVQGVLAVLGAETARARVTSPASRDELAAQLESLSHHPATAAGARTVLSAVAQHVALGAPLPEDDAGQGW